MMAKTRAYTAMTDTANHEDRVKDPEDSEGWTQIHYYPQ